MAIAFASSSPQIATIFSSFHSSSYFSLPSRSRSRTDPSLPSTSPIIIIPSKKVIIFHDPAHDISRRNDKLGPIPAAPEDVLPADTTDQIVSNTSSSLHCLHWAIHSYFWGKSVKVIYLGVTDFLQKREKDKSETEAAANMSGKKKRKVRARAGPRRFGQKIDEDEDYDWDANYYTKAISVPMQSRIEKGFCLNHFLFLFLWLTNYLSFPTDSKCSPQPLQK